MELPTSSLRFPEDLPLREQTAPTKPERPFALSEDLPLREQTVPTEPYQPRALSTELVKETFTQRRYGPARYRLHLEEEKNTGTGQQPLILVARKEPLPPLLCGWVDLAQGEAQVRSYGVLVHRYERRHGEPPPLAEEEYDRFLDKLMDTLFDSGFQILHLVSDEEELRPSGWRGRLLRRSFRSGLGALLLVVGAFALGLNAAHLVPWLSQQIPTWIGLASSWIEQVASWLPSVGSLLG